MSEHSPEIPVLTDNDAAMLMRWQFEAYVSNSAALLEIANAGLVRYVSQFDSGEEEASGPNQSPWAVSPDSIVDLALEKQAAAYAKPEGPEREALLEQATAEVLAASRGIEPRP